MKKLIRQLSTAIVFLIVASPVLATNGYFAHGYGTKNKGLVGAGVALPQDAMIAATNPAGMVFVGERMDVGAAIFSPSPRSYTATGGTGFPDGAACGGPPCPFDIGGTTTQSIESENDYFLIPHFGYNWMLDPSSSVGVTVYGNGGMNTEYKGGVAQHDDGANNTITTPGTFGGGTAGVNLEQLFINTTYARKINSKASWGASIILVYQRFEAKGLAPFAGLSVNPSKLTDNGVDSSTGYGFKLGVQGEVAPDVTLAASYQSKMSMSEFDDYAGLFAEKGDFDIPSSYTVGLAWNTSPRSILVFDIQRINFSEIDSVGNTAASLFPPAFGGSCTAGPTGGTGSGCLGASNGGGFGWEDMTIYKLGYQWTVPSMSDWTWRVGYSRGEQPIPDDEVTFNILAPAVIEQHVTFGFTQTLDPSSEWNFTVMHALENSVKGPNIFSNAGAGPTEEVELEMQQWEFEANYSKKF